MRVFHQIVVEDEEVADGPQAQVQDRSPEVGQHQQADNLPQGPVLRPRRRVHVRREDVIIGNIQHQIHGWICTAWEKTLYYKMEYTAFPRSPVVFCYLLYKSFETFSFGKMF